MTEEKPPIEYPLFTESLSARVVTELELALSKACEHLPKQLDDHTHRAEIAKNMLEWLAAGERSFEGLVAAGLNFIDDLIRDNERQ